jgi:hypothetical protein
MDREAVHMHIGSCRPHQGNMTSYVWLYAHLIYHMCSQVLRAEKPAGGRGRGAGKNKADGPPPCIC